MFNYFRNMRFDFLIAICVLFTLPGCTSYMTVHELEALEKQAEVDRGAVSGKTEEPVVEENVIFRVQIAAEENEAAAHEKAGDAADAGYEPIHIFNADDFWKVQIGDYRTRVEAEEAKKSLLGDGWVGSWITKTELPETFGTRVGGEPSVAEFETNPGFRVQVAAFSDRESADSTAEELRKTVDQAVYIVEEEELFKVQVGDFLEKPAAAVLLNELTNKGYLALWIVETTVVAVRD